MSTEPNSDRTPPAIRVKGINLGDETLISKASRAQLWTPPSLKEPLILLARTSLAGFSDPLPFPELVIGVKDMSTETLCADAIGKPIAASYGRIEGSIRVLKSAIKALKTQDTKDCERISAHADISECLETCSELSYQPEQLHHQAIYHWQSRKIVVSPHALCVMILHNELGNSEALCVEARQIYNKTARWAAGSFAESYVIWILDRELPGDQEKVGVLDRFCSQKARYPISLKSLPWFWSQFPVLTPAEACFIYWCIFNQSSFDWG